VSKAAQAPFALPSNEIARVRILIADDRVAIPNAVRTLAERIGLGSEFPKAERVEVVPSIPNSQETEVAVSI
jgi:hypothetical protein